MALNIATIKRYYKEIYDLMDNQTKILNNIMSFYEGNKKDSKEKIIINLANIIKPLDKVIDHYAELKSKETLSEEEIILSGKINKSIDKTLKAVQYSIAYICKLSNLSTLKPSYGEIESIINLDETIIFNGLIDSLKESLSELEEVLTFLDDNIK